MDREFDRLKDCSKCKREIDEVTVKLKKIIVAGDSYRVKDALHDPRFKFEKLCKECVEGRTK